jgi:hypothetical protein
MPYAEPSIKGGCIAPIPSNAPKKISHFNHQSKSNNRVVTIKSHAEETSSKPNNFIIQKRVTPLKGTKMHKGLDHNEENLLRNILIIESQGKHLPQYTLGGTR